MAPRIGDRRRARVRNDGDAVAGQQAADERRRFLILIVLVQARRRGDNGIAREQVRGAARILSGDERDLAQHPQRPESDVFEVADWRGDHEQRAGHERASQRRGLASPHSS